MVFNVRRNGVQLFTVVSDMFSITSLNLYAFKVGLSFPANFADVYSLDAVLMGGGRRAFSPIDFALVVEES